MSKKSNEPAPALPPIEETTPASAQWDDECDVLVVGFGGAGAATALQAHDDGAKVIVLDRFSGGGATAVSGGIFYTGGGTSIQTEAGVEDNAEEMYNYLHQEIEGAVSDETLREFCESSTETFDWLVERGVPFKAALCPYKTSYPNDDYYLYYSGNEGFSPYKDNAKPAPRGHRAVGKGFGGPSFFEPLRAHAEAQGIDVRYQARVTRLITDGEGSVIGAEYTYIEPGGWAKLHRTLEKTAHAIQNYHPGLAASMIRRCNGIELSHAVTRRVRAVGGVVLSAGGFIYNRDMVKKEAPGYRPGMPLGTPGDSGSGILLGTSVGGATDKLDRVSAWRFINPPEAWTRGIMVDRKGDRYINEMMYGATTGRRMVDDHNGECFLIIDKELKKLSREQIKPGKVQWFQRAPAMLTLFANCKEAATVEEAAAIGKIDPAGLKATIDDYNAGARGEKEDSWGKGSSSLHALDEGPFYVIDASINSKRWPCPTITMGGLIVNEKTGQVKRDDGSLIPGLYAAGRTAVGVCTNGYISGLSIADCVFSGRRAARSLAGQSAEARSTAPAIHA